ncbi:MAG: hypothetical protein A4E42_00994 [Methanoregulaceae archaeon PtaU1.Bin222]|nr:MAG: hypothetical protein A4E42_00994 [Methanoregulaceae archaeon PtaU1.Bin222]
MTLDNACKIPDCSDSVFGNYHLDEIDTLFDVLMAVAEFSVC